MDRQELKSKVVELTKQLTPICDMAVLLGMAESDLRNELAVPASDVCVAYRRARAEVALEIRQRDIDMAAAGSPTAAENVSHHLAKLLQDD